nr:hypothetical protein [uncultured Mucilaginibacter sp.]
MKKYTSIPKYLRQLFYTVLFACISILPPINALAQSVNVSVNIIPPYSPYYSDYSGTNASKVLLIIQNTSDLPLKLKLAGQLKGDNGILIATYTNYVPLQPIILNPHETKQLNGAAMKDIFDLNNLSVAGVDKTKLAITSRLPEGNYTFCIQALDYNSKQLLSATAPLGCTMLTISYPEPPILINPSNNAYTGVSNTPIINFNWFNPGTVPFGTQYTLQVAQMPDIPADPNQVLNATTFPILSRTVTGFGYPYSLFNVPLKKGKKYAWRVISSDPAGKVEFKNKGVSGASVFIYDNMPLPVPPTPAPPMAAIPKPIPVKGALLANDLVIMSPVCRTDLVPDKAGALPSNDVVLGLYSNLNINWLWSEQVNKLKTATEIDASLLTNFTEATLPAGKTKIGKYQLDFTRTTTNKHTNSEKMLLTYTVSAPAEEFKMNWFQALAQGFFYDETYTVKITAFDKAGLVMSSTTSCPFTLREEVMDTNPKLTVAGKLTYTLDQSIYHGANFANITLQLSTKPKPDVVINHINGKDVSTVVLDPARGSVTVNADAEGNFVGQVPINLTNDIGNMYLVARINSYYYAPLAGNIAVTIPKVATVTKNAKVTVVQDTLKLGSIKTTAYNYALTVTLKKGYPNKITNNDFEKEYGGINGFDPIDYSNFNVDTASLNLLGRLPSGIPVQLYRKTKASSLPYYEGDGNQKVMENGTGFIKVAESKTITTPKGVTTAVFNRLICNFQAGDEYYVKAMLLDTGINHTEQLAGPIQKFKFSPATELLQTVTYQKKAIYNIISKKPPMARVKGRVMFQWPSTPGVLHPFANKPFQVTMNVGTNQSPNKHDINCQVYSAELRKPIKLRDGTTKYEPFSPGPSGVVVGRGMTDDKGYFDIQIFDFMQMGDIQGLVLVPTSEPTGPNCAEQEAQRKAVQKEIEKLKLVKVEVGAKDKIIKDGKEVMDDGGQQYIGGLFTNAANTYDFGLPANNQATATDNIAGIADIVDVAMGKVDVYKGGAPAGGGAGAIQAHGPANDNDEAGMSGSIPNEPGIDDRYFSIDGLNKFVSSYNGNSDNKPGHFVVQPFGTVDLGTIVTEEKEIMDYPINIYVNNQPNNSALVNAKVVLFRSKSAPKIPIPDGEGSVSHPTKPLISPNYGGGAAYIKETVSKNHPAGVNSWEDGYVQFEQTKFYMNGPVEWVIDTTYNIHLVADKNYGQINLGKNRLWLGHEKMYSLQVTPQADNGGGSFQPVLVSLPIYNQYTGYLEVNGLTSHNEYTGNKHIEGKKGSDYDKKGVYVEVSASRLAGRVVDASSGRGLNGAKVKLTYTLAGFSKSITLSSVDTSGYFEITNFQNWNFIWSDGSKMTIDVTLDGYDPNSFTFPTILANGSKYFQAIGLTPSKLLKFKVYDKETMENIPCYAKREDGLIFEQSWITKQYQTRVPGGKPQKVILFPINPTHFEDTVTFSNLDAQNTVYLSKRLHRMRFKITDSNGATINSTTFKVVINNDAAKTAETDGDGSVLFNFENVSVNNYVVQVYDKNNTGYIPLVFNLKNLESKTAYFYPVKMIKGLSVSGHVTLTKNGSTQAVSHARVYLDYNWQSDGNYADAGGTHTGYSLLEAFTDANGKYTINGIPPHFGNQPFNIKLHATYEASFTVNGDTKTAMITFNGPNTVDMNLNGDVLPFGTPAIKSIFGYPLTVEKIESFTVSGNVQYHVSGLVNLGVNNSKFVSVDLKDKVRVVDVVFVKNPNATGYEPKLDFAKLDAVPFLKMRYLSKYNVLLKHPNSYTNHILPLMISKTTAAGATGGAVYATVSIVDNSFNYPSTYLSFQDTITQKPASFYMFDASIQNYGMAKPVIKALYNTPYLDNAYHLSDSVRKPLKFSFIGFPATADPDGSVINPDGKIHLKASIEAHVPNSKEGNVTIAFDNLVLDNNNIQATTGAPLAIHLQDWTLNIDKWTIDPTLGGIKSTSAVVKTGIVDIKAKTFNLRHNLFVLKDFDVEHITLGDGLVTLGGIDTANTHLLFDEACGSDHGAHWRFSAISPGNGTVATIPLPAVPGKIAATTLNVNYFQLISYNKENIVSLNGNQAGVKLYNNSKFTYYPTSITSDNNAFALTGTANIDVPRVGNMAMNLIYTKAAGSFNMNPGNYAINFEGKGYVQYTSSAAGIITSSNGSTSIPGTVQEPGKINPIPCTLTFGDDAAQKTGVKLDNFLLRLDGDNTQSPTPKPAATNQLGLAIVSSNTNGMFVQNNDWGTLSFSGELHDPASGALVKTNPTYKFEVLGEITASANDVSMSQATPLGDLQMVYDFPTKTMRGSLHMVDVGFSGYILNGDVEVTNAPDGMLIVGAGQLNTNPIPSGFGTFNIGLLMGNKKPSDVSIGIATQYSKAVENVCWLKERADDFKGFFVTGGYDLINMQKGIDLGIASAYFNAILGIEVSLGADFGSKASLLVLAGAHGEVNAGLDAITGTSISGGLSAHVTAYGTYDPKISVAGNAGVEVHYNISQYIPFFGTKSVGGSIGAGINLTLNKDGSKMTCKFGENGDVPNCPQNHDL